jgi:hypothetical protein
MSKKLLYIVLTVTLLAAAAAASTLPASAQLPDLGGQIVCPVNGLLMTPERCEQLKDRADDVVPGGGDNGALPGGGGGGDGDSTDGGDTGGTGGGGGGTGGGGGGGDFPGVDKEPAPTDEPKPRPKDAGERQEKGAAGNAGQKAGTDLRNPDGSPSRENPTRVEVPGPGAAADLFLPGPSTATAVPNFIIQKFRVPIFLLPIYQAAGTQYGIRWEVLAAINEIETDYGRNLNVSYAGAVGWMQFLPSTWRAYGVDANKDGVKDPYNPVDAIFAAARYLKAAGYGKNPREAIFAYNHADWYVDSVILRARLIAGVPTDLTGSLTGLTEGRFPVYAKATYADDISERETKLLVARSENVAQIEASDPSRREIEIFTRQGAPVIAVNDGEVKEIGSDRRGRYLVLQDVYGNSYFYRGLDSVARFYPVPKSQPKALDQVDSTRANDPAPEGPASAGRQLSGTDSLLARSAADSGVTKERLFAHPARPNARTAGGAAQLVASGVTARLGKGFTTYDKQFSRPFGLDRKGTRPAPLKEGSRVIAGTVLGEVGTPEAGKAPHLDFAIRPAGRGAPRIDPKPILDGWKLLEETAIYRARGENVLRGSTSVGQLLLLSKSLLERRVLADSRIEMYECGRQDVRTGQIDRRVLVTMAYLAESGLRPTVTSLKCGHSTYTSSGNVSNHASGNAVDIAALNGIPVLGHQDPGGVTEQAVRRILQLQGTMTPDEVISLFNFGGPSFAMPDHADHIHVGFTPLYGNNKKLGEQALAVLRPGQWNELIDRLGEIDQPNVVQGPKRFTLPAPGERASRAHRGE